MGLPCVPLSLPFSSPSFPTGTAVWVFFLGSHVTSVRVYSGGCVLALRGTVVFITGPCLCVFNVFFVLTVCCVMSL